MGERILFQVDTEKELEKAFTYLGHIYLKASSTEAATRYIAKNFSACSIYVDATSLTDADAISILNSGASKVFVTRSQLLDIHEKGLVQDLARLVVTYEGPLSRVENEVDTINNVSSDVGLELTGVETVESVKPFLSTNKVSAIYVALKDATGEAVKEIITAGATPIISASGFNTDSRSIALGQLILPIIKTDRPDGLYSTVVSDERGICLGLVYSSFESICESIRTGSGVYQSRHRGLWYKGESSGDVQELVKIGFDCDGDALLFTVRQKGNGKLNCSITISTK
jgi:phosphoribosyl-ATP pyrophosphohydrolase / phosphoribosyl-AMP cyclohydrolase / histidinol dehydrogenase